MKKLILYILFFVPITMAKAQEKFVVYFDSNKSVTNKKENIKLLEWLGSNKDVKVIAIHGFTDEDGTIGFNDTLAKKRVDFVFSQIKNKVKIREDFKTISFGENFNQLNDKSLNRKVTIFYILPKDFSREDEILGIKKDIVSEIKEEIVYPDKMVFETPDGNKTEYKLDIEFMKKIGEAQAGEKLKIENLNFVINTFIVENESKGKMYELLMVLKKNPNLKIQIQGHLCCQPKDRLDLSTQRAKAIYNFLIYNNIEKSRLSYKGFGSSEPIFPLPEKNDAERAANRRVEIQIVSK